MDFHFLGTIFTALLKGLPLTLALGAGSLVGGGVLALALNGLRSSSLLGSMLVDAYVFLFRGSPLLIQIFMIYYGLGSLPALRHSFVWPLLKDPFACALIAFILNDAAYTSEILRGGLRAVSSGLVEAARVCGMSTTTTLRRIVLPLAVRQALPAYSNEVVAMVKATSLASTISLYDVTGIVRAEVSNTYRAIEIFACAAAIYFVLTLIVARVFDTAERRLSPDRFGGRR